MDDVAVAGRSFGCVRASFRFVRFEELRSHQAGGERAVARRGEVCLENGGGGRVWCGYVKEEGVIYCWSGDDMIMR